MQEGATLLFILRPEPAKIKRKIGNLTEKTVYFCRNNSFSMQLNILKRKNSPDWRTSIKGGTDRRKYPVN
ncbi:hypothetical protein HMPREF1141_3131 [Clostridium sp. MSTE9]|nr:hypothetical protein HMPREF1141_3131 [Clostridium sp. MSTE9]